MPRRDALVVASIEPRVSQRSDTPSESSRSPLPSMPESLVYSLSNERDEDSSLERSPCHNFPAPSRTRGSAVNTPAPALFCPPSDASSLSLPDPTTLPLPHEYLSGANAEVGSSAASLSSSGGRRAPRSSIRNSGTSFGDVPATGEPSERWIAYDDGNLLEEEHSAVEHIRSARADSYANASSGDGVHYNRYSAQPTWSRSQRSQPTTGGSLMGKSLLSAASSPDHVRPTQVVVGLGFSTSQSAHPDSDAHPSRESSTTSSAGGLRWSQAFSHSATSSMCDHVVPYDSDDDKSVDGTSETSQYDWESSGPHRADMSEGAAVVLVEDGRGKVVQGEAMDMTRPDRLKGELAGAAPRSAQLCFWSRSSCSLRSTLFHQAQPTSFFRRRQRLILCQLSFAMSFRALQPRSSFSISRRASYQLSLPKSFTLATLKNSTFHAIQSGRFPPRSANFTRFVCSQQTVLAAAACLPSLASSRACTH